MEKIDELNIAALPIADKVRRHAQASFYAALLDALQEESRRFGYHFSASGYRHDYLSSDLRECLARAVILRRQIFLYPHCHSKDRQETVDSEMTEGYGETFLTVLLNALEALGIHIKEGPDADALAGIAKSRRLERMEERSRLEKTAYAPLGAIFREKATTSAPFDLPVEDGCA